MIEKYQKYFMLNKNILIAFGASIIISAVVAQTLSEQADYLNTTYTLLVDYVVYFSIFGGLYYLDNRKKYLHDSDKSKLKHDLIKIITSLGIAEIVYTILRWLLQYYFLNINYDAYLASITSQIISTIIYMIVVNLSVKMTRLYKDGN
jgi:hypothetical protein